MTPVRVKTVKTQSRMVHLSFRKIQASREVNTGLLRSQEMTGTKRSTAEVERFKVRYVTD